MWLYLLEGEFNLGDFGNNKKISREEYEEDECYSKNSNLIEKKKRRRERGRKGRRAKESGNLFFFERKGQCNTTTPT